MFTNRPVGLAVLLAFNCMTSVTAAQPGKNDAGAARVLFNEGKSLWESGDRQGACQRFDESLDRVPNVSVWIKVARCREHEGKLAAAAKAYESARALNKAEQSPERRAALETIIAAESAKLEPRVPRLRIVVEGAPEGLSASLDGMPIGQESLDSPLLVDPGKHEISVVAPQYVEETKTVTFRERTTADEVVEVSFRLAATPKTAAPLPPNTHGQPTTPPQAIEPTTTPSPGAPHGAPSATGLDDQMGPRHTTGYVVGGVGAVGLTTAGVLGIATLAYVKKSNPHCKHEGGTCDDTGMELRETAGKLQTAGIVAAAVSGVALATGIILVVSNRRAQKTTLHVGPGSIAGRLQW